MAISPTQAVQPRPLAGGPRRRLVMAGGMQAPERARAWLHNVARWLDREIEQTLALLISELVNNAVRHGGAGDGELIELELRATADGVGVEVSDPGPGFAPRERERPLEEPGGWGLVLVDQMADRWGVTHDGRTHVWFELRATAG
jgi:anti-sigma regulatory factor (Ser/Thr protein kinase)